jgi:uncharacterized protein YjiK
VRLRLSPLSRSAALLCGALALFAGAALSGKPFAALQPESAPVRLPFELAEISGLSPAGGSSVFAQNDEQAKIFEVDIRSGKVLRAVSLGRPPVVGDFEAITVAGADAALITSRGVLLTAKLRQGARTLSFRTADTALGDGCEIEGLAHADADGGYFIACKHAGRRLLIYRWSAHSGAEKAVDMSLRDAVPNPKAFRVTDLVHDPRSGTLLVLDSAAGAILEVSLKGKPVGYWRLGGVHPQAEGLALLGDGRLVVADEGRIGDGKLTPAALTVYKPRH